MAFVPDAPTPSFKPDAAPAKDASKPTPSFQPEAVKPPTPSFKPELTDVHGSVPTPEEPYPGNYSEHTLSPAEPPSSFGESVAEDWRRTKEFVHEAPAKLGTIAWKAGEALTDLPLRQMAVQQNLTGDSGLKGILDAQGIKAPQPSTYTPPPSPVEGAGGSRPDTPVAEASAVPISQQPLDYTPDIAGMQGVSARQWLNKGVDASLGRAIRFGQWLIGRPVSQMMATAAAVGAPFLDEMPEIKAAKELGLIAQTGPGDDYGAKQWLKLLNPDIVPPEGSTEELAYHKRLQDMYGKDMAELFKGGVMLGQQWPVMLLPGTEGTWATQGEQAALREASTLAPRALREALPTVESAAKSSALKSNIAAGAVQSAYMAAANKEDFVNSLEEGTALSGVLGILHAQVAPRAAVKSLVRGLATPAGATAPAAVIFPKTMQAFKSELDGIIARSEPTKRVAGSVSTDARRALEGQMFADQLGPGEHNFDLQEGDVRHPTFSAPALVEKPSLDPAKDPRPYKILVMRDYEITAGPGKATAGNEGPAGARAKAKPVIVEPKGRPEWAKTKTPKASAQSTNVTVRYRDTPIKDAEALQRLSTQKGRMVHDAAMDDETRAIVTQMTHNLVASDPNMMLSGQGSIFNGEEPVGYMDPATEGKAYLAHKIATGQATTEQLNELIRPEKPVIRADANAETPVVMTAKPDGRVKMTPVIPPKPRAPNTREFHAGDFVGVGHPELGWKGTVEGITAEGDPIVTGPNGEAQVHPKGDVYLSQDMTSERARMASYSLSKTDATAKPDIGDALGARSSRVEAIALANKDFTLPDLLRWDKRKPTQLGWAAQTAHDMVDRGLIKEVRPGVFEPTRRREPVNPDISPEAAGGQLVYHDTGGASSDGQWGVLRGPDTRTKGNWLIEVPDAARGTKPHPFAGTVFKRTRYISVPEEEVRTKWPVLMADKSKINPDIDAFGWTKPMPPQFIAKETVDEVQKMKDAWSRVASAPGVAHIINKQGDAVWNNIVGAMHQADPLIRKSAAQKAFAAPHMMRSEALSTNQFLESKLGRGSPANQELALILEQHRARSPSGQSQGIDPALLSNWAQKYPKEAAASMDDIKKMTAILDQQSQQLAQRGVGNVAALEAKRANDQIPEYLTTNYAAFQMPRKEWADFARENLTQEFHDLINWMQKARPDKSGSQVVAEIDRILRLENPIKGFEDKGYIKAEAKAKLGEKQAVPQPIRAILGEHKDASMRLSFTLAYQRQLLKGMEAFDAIAAHPELWSPGWRPDMTLQVPADNPLFGNAQGGFVADNPATRLLVEGPKMTDNSQSAAFLRAAGWLGQKWKTGHTVYNQASWVANMARNVKGVMLSPWEPSGYREAAQMLSDYGRDPTVYGPNKLLVEAMDFDAVGPGLAGAELGAEQRKFQRRVFDTFRASKGGFMDTLADLRDHALSVPEKIHSGYDSIDKVAKFGSYINWRRKFIASGMSIDDAAALASLRVNELFPNYTGTAAWARNNFGGARWTVGLAPYATSKLEDVRINGNITKNLIGALLPAGAKPKYFDPELAPRLLALTAMVGGAAALAIQTRRMNGISDQEDAAQRATIPIKSQKYSHLLLGSLDYDQHGRRTFYPIDTYEDLAMTLSGNKGDDPVVRSILNNVLDVVGPDSLQGQALTSAAARAGVITPEDPARLPRADQTGPLATIGQYAPPFLPQAPFKAAAAVNATQPSGRLVNPEALTVDQGLMQGLGLGRPMVVGPQTRTQTVLESAHNIAQKKTDIKSAAEEAALQKVSSERQKYMIESNVRALKKAVNIPRPLKTGPNGGTK